MMNSLINPRLLTGSLEGVEKERSVHKEKGLTRVRLTRIVEGVKAGQVYVSRLFEI